MEYEPSPLNKFWSHIDGLVQVYSFSGALAVNIPALH